MKDTICCFAAQGPQSLLYGYDEGNPDCIKFILKLALEIELMINKGCTTFITGVDSWPEIWFAESVLDIKHGYPEKNIRLIVALPYQKKVHRLDRTYSQRHGRILSQANAVVTMAKQYHAGCVEERNQYMIAQSSHMIAVWYGKNDGIKGMIACAESSGLDIIILNHNDFKTKRKFFFT